MSLRSHGDIEERHGTHATGTSALTDDRESPECGRDQDAERNPHGHACLEEESRAHADEDPHDRYARDLHATGHAGLAIEVPEVGSEETMTDQPVFQPGAALREEPAGRDQKDGRR